MREAVREAAREKDKGGREKGSEGERETREIEDRQRQRERERETYCTHV